MSFIPLVTIFPLLQTNDAQESADIICSEDFSLLSHLLPEWLTSLRSTHSKPFCIERLQISAQYRVRILHSHENICRCF